MLKMSCRWWPIWYLLFFCHGAEGQLQWVVQEKVTAYGQNLILFCPVENCCNELTSWTVNKKAIILDIKTFSNDPNVKYHGTFDTDGFGFVIRNLSKADLNVAYRCGYGFTQSTPKYLLYGDVFRESTGNLQWVVEEKVTDYGQNLILFCPVENCCSEPAGWSVGPKSIFSDVKTFSNDPKVKYGGRYNTDGFGFVIRNLSETDLNITYHCVYGHNQSTPEYLLHGDVFRESTDVPDKDKDKDEENNTVTILLIVVPIVVIILVGAMIMAYFVYRSHSPSSPEEVPLVEDVVPVIELKKTKFTVYQEEEVLIDCSAIENNANAIGQPYWEKFEENGESCNLRIKEDKEGKYGLKRDPPSLKILYVQMSDRGYYQCCIDYSTFNGNETARSEKAKLIIEKIPVIEMKQNTLTVYESESVSIRCEKIINKKNDDQVFWERIDDNNKENNLKIKEKKEGRFNLEIDPPCLTILDARMSDSGDYYCRIEYSISGGKKTVKSQKAHVIIEKIPVIKLKQDTFTVYETEEVSIKCNEIRSKKKEDQVFWERIDDNNKENNLKIKEKKEDIFDLETDPPCLKILNVQMSDSGDYYCCMEYSTSAEKKTARSQKAHLIIKKKTEVEDLYKGIAKEYGMEPKIPNALLDDKTFYRRLIEECRKDIKHHSEVNSRGNEYFPAALLELVTNCPQQHTELIDTILNNMLKTLTAHSSSTVVLLCHRAVKSAMKKACKDSKKQTKIFGQFIEEHKFYYNDSFRQQYISQGNEAVT